MTPLLAFLRQWRLSIWRGKSLWEIEGSSLMNGERMVCMYLLQRASLCGISSQRILEELQLTAGFFETASSQSIAEMLPSVLLSVTRLSGNDRFGIEAAQHLHPCLLGSCGLAATHAPSLEKMFHTFAEFGNQLATWYQLTSESSSDETTWTLQIDAGLGEIAESAAIAWVTAMVAFGRLANGNEFHAKKIRLVQSAPSKACFLQEYFQCEIEFDSGSNEVVIARSTLTVESRLNDPLLFDQLTFAASALKRQLDGSSISGAVEQAIQLGAFDLAEIGKTLGITERTVQRRLKEEGTTFQDRLDAIRLRMADTYLKLPSLTVEEIATRIGFSSDKAFRTAYRRWTGRSPRESE